MSRTSLEERVEALELELARLKEAFGLRERPKDWTRTVGMFDDDPGFEEILKLGREYRERDRDSSRP